MAEKIPIVVILGATGAGKSKLALELAQKFGGEIVSADAMQMYKGLDIITNKVTIEEQLLVKHHMIDILDSLAVNTVVEFRNTVLPIMEDLVEKGKIPFICGGTNYYIESLLWKVLIEEAPLTSTHTKRKNSVAESDINKKCKNITEDISGPEKQLSGESEKLLEISQFDFDRDEDETVSTQQLFKLLKQVDPVRAEHLHPNERRKMWRSLQVWQQHGVEHSRLLASQNGVLGGGLRFPANRVCIIEVWSEQNILDQRCDRRVDKMVERGMVQELADFYKDITQSKNDCGETLDYTKGILQSIGFKEFRSFLALDPQDRNTEIGTKQFEQGVNLLKIATRQYSRRQAKWMKRRFLLESRDAPPVYRVNSSDPEHWQQNCFDPAVSILSAYLEGSTPEAQPLARISVPKEEHDENRRTFHCNICQRHFSGLLQLNAHLSGKKHLKEVRLNQASLPPTALILTHYDQSKRSESAKILKKSFDKPLHEVLQMLDEAPCEIATVQPKSKAENLRKCLAKHGILVELKSV